MIMLFDMIDHCSLNMLWITVILLFNSKWYTHVWTLLFIKLISRLHYYKVKILQDSPNNPPDKVAAGSDVTTLLEQEKEDKSDLKKQLV